MTFTDLETVNTVVSIISSNLNTQWTYTDNGDETYFVELPTSDIGMAGLEPYITHQGE